MRNLFVTAIFVTVLTSCTEDVEEFQSIYQDAHPEAVDISGDFAIVGIPRRYWGPGVRHGGGGAYVYRRSTDGWSRMQLLVDSSGDVDDNLGRCVAISGDNAVLGGELHPFIVFYRFNGTRWAPLQRIMGTGGRYFGWSASMDGNLAVVSKFGAYEPFLGEVNVYRLSGDSWELIQVINDPSAINSRSFGYSVSLSGNTLVVGSPEETIGGNVKQGSVSVFEFDGARFIFQQKLTDGTGGTDRRFGRSVNISSPNYFIAGSTSDTTDADRRGTVSIFRRSGTRWSLNTKLNSMRTEHFDDFGAAVAINGDYAVVGSPGFDIGRGLDHGAVYLYRRDGTAWSEIGDVLHPETRANDKFGYAVALEEGTSRVFSAISFNSGDSSLPRLGKVIFGQIRE